jgi:rod shape-determining protein MreC
MHDRAVRRRRAVLVVLVAASLFLLTAYFGESSNGQLHSVQRGAMAALAPIQEGASRVLKPFRDLFGWFGDTIHAKSQRDALRKQVDAYRVQLAQKDQQLSQALQQAGLKQVDSTGGMGQYAPGSVTPSLGATGDLLFDLVDNVSKVKTGDLIVTAGTTDSRLQSPFPAGIPIGTVKRIDLGSGDLDPRIHVTPAADVRKLDLVQVLTKPHANLTASVK